LAKRLPGGQSTLFKERLLKVKITFLQSPHTFIDEQVEGDFAMLKHEHFFKPIQNGTLMIDQFRYEIGMDASATF
jgi:ligand-binding SRPBCC domain-containing protein